MADEIALQKAVTDQLDKLFNRVFNVSLSEGSRMTDADRDWFLAKMIHTPERETIFPYLDTIHSIIIYSEQLPRTWVKDFFLFHSLYHNLSIVCLGLNGESVEKWALDHLLTIVFSHHGAASAGDELFAKGRDWVQGYLRKKASENLEKTSPAIAADKADKARGKLVRPDQAAFPLSSYPMVSLPDQSKFFKEYHSPDVAYLCFGVFWRFVLGATLPPDPFLGINVEEAMDERDDLSDTSGEPEGITGSGCDGEEVGPDPDAIRARSILPEVIKLVRAGNMTRAVQLVQGAGDQELFLNDSFWSSLNFLTHFLLYSQSKPLFSVGQKEFVWKSMFQYLRYSNLAEGQNPRFFLSVLSSLDLSVRRHFYKRLLSSPMGENLIDSYPNLLLGLRKEWFFGEDLTIDGRKASLFEWLLNQGEETQAYLARVLLSASLYPAQLLANGLLGHGAGQQDAQREEAAALFFKVAAFYPFFLYQIHNLVVAYFHADLLFTRRSLPGQPLCDGVSAFELLLKTEPGQKFLLAFHSSVPQLSWMIPVDQFDLTQPVPFARPGYTLFDQICETSAGRKLLGALFLDSNNKSKLSACGDDWFLLLLEGYFEKDRLKAFFDENPDLSQVLFARVSEAMREDRQERVEDESRSHIKSCSHEEGYIARLRGMLYAAKPKAQKQPRVIKRKAGPEVEASSESRKTLAVMNGSDTSRPSQIPVTRPKPSCPFKFGVDENGQFKSEGLLGIEYLKQCDKIAASEPPPGSSFFNPPAIDKENSGVPAEVAQNKRAP